MLTGDSNLACWDRILNYYEGRTEEETGTEVLKADVLHASHHGSRTFFKDDGEDSEPSLEALQTIDPEGVVVSVGENNRYDHPDEDMMDAYREQVGDDFVYETRTVIMEVDNGSPYRLVLNPGSYIEDYGWSEDDDDDEGTGEKEPDGGGGGAGKLAVGLAAGLGVAALAKRRRSGSPTRLDDQPAA